MPQASRDKINFLPLRMLTTLRVAVAALLVAFAVLLFLSFGPPQEEPVRIEFSPPTAKPGEEIVDHSDNFEITGTKGTEDSFRMRAEELTGLVGDKKILKGVQLEVYGREGANLTLTGTDGQFEMNEKRALLSGDVLVTDEDGFGLRTGTLYYDGERQMIFTPDTISFENGDLTGTGRGLNYLTKTEVFKIPSEVRIVTRPHSPEASPITITSGDLTLGLKDNELVFHDSVVLTRDSQSISGNYLKAVFDKETRNLISVNAYGQVSATFSPEAEPPGETVVLETDSLIATFDPEKTDLQRVEALGHCRLTRGGVLATSETIEAENLLQRIALRGDPIVVDPRSRISATEIDLLPVEKGLEARGDVKTSLFPETGQTESSMPNPFTPSKIVYFQADRLVIEDNGNLARYSGGARGWQGDDSIQANEILFHLGDRRMRAFRNVLCRFGEEDPDTSLSPPTTTVILADAMDFDEAEGIIHYRNQVKLTRGAATLTADRMDVRLSDPDAGRRRVETVQATGSARFRHLDNVGKADRLTYTPATHLAEMHQDAGLAEVVDQINGRTLRGKTLTFDLNANRVLTEQTVGGRTWIKLNPKDEDEELLESKIGN